MSGTDVPVRIRRRIVQVDVKATISAIVRVATDDRQGAIITPIFILNPSNQEGEVSPLDAIASIHLSSKWFARKSGTDVPVRIRRRNVQADAKATTSAIVRVATDDRQGYDCCIYPVIIAVICRFTTAYG